MGIFEFMGYVFVGSFIWVIAPFVVVASLIFLYLFGGLIFISVLHYGALIKRKFTNYSRDERRR